MDSESAQASSHASSAPAEWREAVKRFQVPSTGRALWQLVNSIGLYLLLWYAMTLAVAVSYWLVLPLAVLTGLVMVRVFIIFHDCGHGSFFKSQTANDVVGFITGVLTLTPYAHWRWEHSIHHASAGHLDKRGIGDVWTMTVEEYLKSSRWRRFAYRLARNPFILFVLAPIYLFVIHQRIPTSSANARQRASVHWTSLAILAIGLGMSAIYGWKAYLMMHLSVVLFGGCVGIWIFYVQHQFEDVYWERGDNWDYTAAGLQGSSFYKLPRILQWFTGNIGFHHIHHLSSRIPNYNLERCHEANSLFQQVKPIGFFQSLRSLQFRFWDEQMRKLIGYRQLKILRKERALAGQQTQGAG